MTMVWCEGFETFGLGVNRSEIDDVYDFGSVYSTSEVTIVAGRPLDGYETERAVKITPNTVIAEDDSDALKLSTVELSSEDDWIVGFAFKVTGAFQNQRSRLLSFKNEDEQVLLSVCLNANGAGLSIRRGGGSGGTQLATYAVSLSLGDWYYLEVKVNFHGSTGSYEVKLGVGGDEPATVMSASGVNTTATGGVRPYQICLGATVSPTSSLPSYYYDDWVVMDDQGSVNNDFLGDVQIIKIRPSSPGDQTDLTPNTGSNWDAVNEDTEDGFTTYVETNVVNEFDLYNYEDIALAGDIFACVPKPVVTKEPSGTRSFRALCKSNGTTENGATQQPSSGSFTRRQHIYEQDPDGPQAWTVAAVNAAQFGLQIVA